MMPIYAMNGHGVTEFDSRGILGNRFITINREVIDFATSG